MLRLKQGYVADMAGISQECLSRFERGRASELGSRKLLAILDVLGMELSLKVKTSTDNAQVDSLANTNHAN
ncbi:helix-turn-helix transcriptional regulator [Pseudomonas protegens]|nr:helix-turn-helix transcriptional regulator [Pseudomonas protegens]